ncbi:MULTISPECIES: fibronectin type III domain-containing protein [unclassified Enterococcus]|uniref:fibronectin type III domain-containing protein n=1 Tax=unclassified Enterococcus TaxID=2608891 RepID=UPI001556B83E|nr:MULTISPECIES: fibronectin type III domain-containing protein [unclassified Enterococcus]MBS7576424.1 fibronectin type III domain-containing protein [Enterococcus sp. MMGLQ5-2]MBS7583656.1 fibronectin type III domain-containing protein [Enterococcus sp. MMGLQ5-1]NPD11517.1 LPXTG cell wall anchor domain-containing protein [Enterococcus sp. MMGLQ5-1]NPD36261.1 LPXTG cell wall anchor domain-containing protein [Enterococcus sp. MMGLQ5-2]
MKKHRWLIAIILFLGSIGISWFSNPVQAEETANTQTLIEQSSDWQYYYQSADQYPGNEWLQPNYDATAWQTGQAPIGYSTKATVQTTIDYGSDKKNKYPVAFFRKSFDAKIDAANKDYFNTLVLDYKLDDSAVIYINGQEVKRINYPSGVAPDFTTYSNQLGNDGNDFEQASVDLSNVTLKETGNVVAVAVFQQSGSSSDLVFDLSLSLQQTEAPNPAVSQKPTKMSVTFYGDTATSKSFTWHTLATAGSQIRYIASAAEPADFTNASVVEGTETYSEELADFVHKAVLTDLQAGTAYWYQVGDASTNQWSEPAQFTTSATSNSPFHFLFFDDTQGSDAYDYEIVAKTFNQGLATAPNASFIIQGGDLVNNSNNIEQWQDLFGKQQAIWSNHTIMTVSGNHDTYNNTFYNHFNYNAPSTGVQSHGVYYSYDYQQAHYVMLNTNDIVNNQLSSTQVAWLTSDIEQAKANGAKWVIVTMHKGTQTVANHISDSDVVGMRKQLQPLFDQLGVDLVLQGHDHTYARTNQMGGEVPYEDTEYQEIDGVQTAVNPKGAVYLTSDSSGTKFYNMQSDDVIAQYGVYPAIKGQEFKQMFTDIAIVDDRLVLKSYLYDAEGTGEVSLYDSYAIQKQEPVEIAAIEAPAAITVPFGTAVEKLSLPVTVKVTLNDKSVIDVPVTWTTTGYAANQAGMVQLTGILDFSKTDYSALSGTTSIDVTVADKPAELTLTYPKGEKDELKVGESITIVPSIEDGQVGEAGWQWDKDFFSATFNSPATFTALKAGKTTVSYTSAAGQTVEKTFTIVEAVPTSSDVPNASTQNNINQNINTNVAQVKSAKALPTTGESSTASIAIAGILLMVTVAGIITMRRKIKEL